MFIQTWDDAPKADAKNYGPYRFYIPKGEKKRVIFLTKTPVQYYEHAFKIGAKFNNIVTCLKNDPKDECPACEYAQRTGNGYKYFAAAYTVIDLDGYENKAGEKVTNVKTLFVAKKSTYEILKRRHLSRVQAGEELCGSLMEIYRGSDTKAPGVGTDFEFVKWYPLAEIADKFKVDTTEFDYKEILKPDRKKMMEYIEQLKAMEGPAKNPEEPKY